MTNTILPRKKPKETTSKQTPQQQQTPVKSRWETFKQEGLEKLKKAKQAVGKTAANVKTNLEQTTQAVAAEAEVAKKYASKLGRGAKALYWYLPRYGIAELTGDEETKAELEKNVNEMEEEERKENERQKPKK